MNIMELFKLDGRNGLVTGAGRGIGRVLAISLAQAGCDIAICEKNIDDAQNVVEEIKKIGKKAVAFQADVTKKDDLERAFSTLAKQLGGLDIVINNAGVFCNNEAAETTTEEHFDYVVDTDLKGVFLCCQAAAKIMIPKKKGSIINIASMSGIVANYPQKQACYNAAKAGVILLTKCLAVEWAGYGIRVNSISPGYTRTEMTIKPSDPEMVAQWESLTPMKRRADPQELAGAAIYLASDAASYTTGSDIIVDGGYTSL
jgi:NAD(P)-dependent dehydrogenase (short-subunit alcohol dehydrogenase family)